MRRDGQVGGLGLAWPTALGRTCLRRGRAGRPISGGPVVVVVAIVVVDMVGFEVSGGACGFVQPGRIVGSHCLR